MKTFPEFIVESALDNFRNQKKEEYKKKYGDEWRSKLDHHVWSHFKKKSVKKNPEKEDKTKAPELETKNNNKNVIIHPTHTDYKEIKTEK